MGRSGNSAITIGEALGALVDVVRRIRASSWTTDSTIS
jgi:hypothetical protein